MVEIRACDPYNNNATAIINITIEDTTLPTWDEALVNRIHEFGLVFSYDVNASDLSGIAFYWINDTTNFVEVASGQWTAPSTQVTYTIPSMDLGKYFYKFEATDSYGNTASDTVDVTITVDQEEPEEGRESSAPSPPWFLIQEEERRHRVGFLP